MDRPEIPYARRRELPSIDMLTTRQQTGRPDQTRLIVNIGSPTLVQFDSAPLFSYRPQTRCIHWISDQKFRPRLPARPVFAGLVLVDLLDAHADIDRQSEGPAAANAGLQTNTQINDRCLNKGGTAVAHPADPWSIVFSLAPCFCCLSMPMEMCNSTGKHLLERPAPAPTNLALLPPPPRVNLPPSPPRTTETVAPIHPRSSHVIPLRTAVLSRRVDTSETLHENGQRVAPAIQTERRTNETTPPPMQPLPCNNAFVRGPQTIADITHRRLPGSQQQQQRFWP
ncbi:hypothetical protein MMC15_000754 [Xylographa vitiligo]|nr:hypothetical protein [Xylographa vitiligo]